MTIVSAGETFEVDTTWFDSATSSTVSGSVLYGGSGGPVYMSGVFTVTDTVVQGGGDLDVLSGGVASGTVVSAAGFAYVFAGGVASGTVVLSSGTDGFEIVESGGVANDTVLSGSEEVASGGVASGTVVRGGGDGVDSGGLARGTVVSTGSEVVEGGGVASGTVVSSGGEENLNGGAGNGTVVSSGGIEIVQDASVASGTVVSNGGYIELPLTSGYGQWSPISANVIKGVTIETGAIVGLQIHQGGSISGFTALGDDFVVVYSGGVTSGTVISSGSYEDVESGGAASGTVVSSGGEQDVYGTAISTTIQSGGSGYVGDGDFGQAGGSGGVASGTVVSGGGYQEVDSGGVASSNVVIGNLQVLSGGTAVSTAIQSGGEEIVSSGGTTSDTVISGGTLDVQSGGLVSGSITFASGTSGTLQIDGTTMPTAVISGLAPSTLVSGSLAGDTIDLTGVNFSGGGSVQLLSGNVLQIIAGGNTGTPYDLQLDPGQDFSKDSFKLTPDQGTGVDIHLNAGLSINATYDSSVTSAFKSNIISAEQDLESRWTNPVTLNLDFTAQADGTNTFLAENSWSSLVDVTYAQLKSALASHEFSSYAVAAVASLPATDPNPTGGADWALPEAYARMLALSSSIPSIDDTITLNTSYDWSYGQDVIDTIEHEISEGGMGRVGGLGDQNGVWSTMDLFRYSAAGVPDYADGRDGVTTYFSYNGGTQLTSLSFNNEYNSSDVKVNSGDTADFTQQDVFGTGQTGETNTLSQTDIQIMDALGWAPVACFCGGTLISTERGEVPVEELAIGDKVVTLSGGARPIKWIGHRAYDPRFVAGNRKVWPIRIEAEALGEGVPGRDLRVSPEHALYIGKLLVPAHLLVNGATITQVESIERIEYFHIELDTHDVILAEGAPAETFVDCDNRFMFHNGREFAALYPGLTPPGWEFCAPRVAEGSPELAAIRRAVLARAELFHRFTGDPDLHLVVDDRVVRPHSVGHHTLYRFQVPAGAGSISLASRTNVPAKVGISPADGRRLGVAVERIVLRDAGLSKEIGHASPTLSDGFHEPAGSHRWTDGSGRVPSGWFAAFAGDFILEVHLAETEMRYGLETSAAATTIKARKGLNSNRAPARRRARRAA